MSPPDVPLYQPRASILIVDDEPTACTLLQEFLKRQGYVTMAVGHMADAVRLAGLHCFDLVVLDLDLLKSDGLDVCRQIRRRSFVPLVAVSADGQTRQVVAALESGADDFVVKDRYSVELAPRIQALLRRYPHKASRLVYQKGRLLIFTEQRLVIVGNQPIGLTPAEFAFLCCLIEHGGRPVSKERLSAAVWNTSEMMSDQIRALVKRLRLKLEENPARPQHINTVRGIGYQLS